MAGGPVAGAAYAEPAGLLPCEPSGHGDRLVPSQDALPEGRLSALWLGLIQDIALAHLARLLADGLERRLRSKAGDRAWQILVLRVASHLLNRAILVPMASVEARLFHG